MSAFSIWVKLHCQKCNGRRLLAIVIVLLYVLVMSIGWIAGLRPHDILADVTAIYNS